MTTFIQRVMIFLRIVGRWHWAKGSAADDAGNFRRGLEFSWVVAGILARGDD